MSHGFRLLGMSSREVRMYAAFLDGPRGAREAAEIAGLHRATAYRVLIRLLDRGLIQTDGQVPRRFRAVDPTILFHRLELFYRDETEIPNCFVEAFGQAPELRPKGPSTFPAPTGTLRVLAAEGRSTYPAIAVLSQAKTSVAAVVHPMSNPAGFRNALARALGHLARSGVRVRLITDALPVDYRFYRAVVREAGPASASVEVRHLCPCLSQLFLIDRQTVLRIPTLGVSNRAPPIAVAVNDRARVRLYVARFEALWTEAAGSPRTAPMGHEPMWVPASGSPSSTANT